MRPGGADGPIVSEHGDREPRQPERQRYAAASDPPFYDDEETVLLYRQAVPAARQEVSSPSGYPVDEKTLQIARRLIAGADAPSVGKAKKEKASRSADRSLAKNSTMLLANLIVGSVGGFVFYTVLARLYSTHDVGVASAAFSSTSLIVSLSGLGGFTYSLVRMLPEISDKRALINAALMVVGVASLAIGVVFVAWPPATGHSVTLQDPVFASVFVIGGVVTALKGVLDSLHNAHRDAPMILAGGVLTTVVRIILPVVAVSFGVLGIYLSQAVATGCGLVLLAISLMSRHHHGFRVQIRIPDGQEFVRLSGVNYLTSIVGGLPVALLPLLVVSHLGPEQNAVWSIAMLIASACFMLPSAISQALLAEGAHNPDERMRLLRRSTVVLFALLTPIILAGIFLAPYGLAVFGDEYRDGGVYALRILLLSGFLVAGNYVAGAVLFFAKEVTVPLVVNILNAALVLILTAAWATSLRDVATYWFLGEILNVVLFGAGAVHAARGLQARERGGARRSHAAKRGAERRRELRSALRHAPGRGKSRPS